LGWRLEYSGLCSREDPKISSVISALEFHCCPPFRPNIMVGTRNSEKDFVENAWIGQILAIGDGVRLSITGPCPRCVMTTLSQGDLPKDAGSLRTAQHNLANVGVYASVLQGGKVRRGDDKSSLLTLKSLISQADLILETTPDLPQNRTASCRETLRVALALTDDLIKQQRMTPAVAMGNCWDIKTST
jgi:MOSC domain-containing protein YiiM